MVIFFLVLVLSYVLLMLTLLKGWRSIELPGKYNHSQNQALFVSVLIPVRNEATNIKSLLSDLASQTFPQEQFEVIIVNDSSVDDTSAIVSGFIEKSPIDFRLINLKEIAYNPSPKKRAIQEGIAQSKGELIITTDGDCRVGPKWIETYASFQSKTKARFISSGVYFQLGKKFIDKLFQLEFLTLIGTGASSLKLGYPNMCNGANMAYTKEVFYEVEGFKDNDKIASGDDEFLMHKVYRKYPDDVRFLKDNDAYVCTSPPENLKHFYNQRKRWASKWGNYIFDHVQYLAAYVFVFNFFQLIMLVLTLAGIFPLYTFLSIILIKSGVEFVLLYRLAHDFKLKLYILSFLLIQLVYPFYVILFGLAGRKGRFKWKEREIKLRYE